jgi:hypothetical protein
MSHEFALSFWENNELEENIVGYLPLGRIRSFSRRIRSFTP